MEPKKVNITITNYPEPIDDIETIAAIMSTSVRKTPWQEVKINAPQVWEEEMKRATAAFKLHPSTFWQQYPRIKPPVVGFGIGLKVSAPLLFYTEDSGGQKIHLGYYDGAADCFFEAGDLSLFKYGEFVKMWFQFQMPPVCQ